MEMAETAVMAGKNSRNGGSSRKTIIGIMYINVWENILAEPAGVVEWWCHGIANWVCGLNPTGGFLFLSVPY